MIFYKEINFISYSGDVTQTVMSQCLKTGIWEVLLKLPIFEKNTPDLNNQKSLKRNSYKILFYQKVVANFSLENYNCSF